MRGDATGPCGLRGTLRNSAGHLVDTGDGGRNNVKGDGGPGCCDSGVGHRVVVAWCRVVVHSSAAKRGSKRVKFARLRLRSNWAARHARSEQRWGSNWVQRVQRAQQRVQRVQRVRLRSSVGAGMQSDCTGTNAKGGEKEEAVVPGKESSRLQPVDAAIAVFYSGLRFGLELEEFDRACRPRARRTSWPAGGCSC